MKRNFTWYIWNAFLVLVFFTQISLVSAQDYNETGASILIDPTSVTSDLIALNSSFSTERYAYQLMSAAANVTFAPDNADAANPTPVTVGQVFTLQFAGALYTYVSSTQDNNIQVDEAYLQNCFTLTNTDDASAVAFTVALTEWSATSTVVTITPDSPLTGESHITLAVLDDKLQINVRNVNPLGNGDFITDIYAENNYLTEDITAPILDVDADTGLWEDGMYPGTGETILSGDQLQLDFVEPVMAGTGNILIYTWNGLLVKTIDASTLTTDPSDPSIIIISDTSGLTINQDYYVVVPAGAITDLSGNSFAGIDEEDDWSFTVEPDQVPDLVRFTPTGSNISVTTDLMIEFDLPVSLGSAGTVSVYTTDGTLVQSLNVVSDAMYFSIIGDKVYIDINELDQSTAYMVSVDAGAFESSTGEPSAAIVTADWQFETENNDAPLLVSLTPPDNSVDVPLDQLYVMEFDMDVQAGSGIFELHIGDGQNTIVTTLTSTDSRVTITGNKASIDLTGLTEADTKYYIIVYADFVQNTSSSAEPFAGILKVFSWNFSTVLTETTPPEVILLSPDNTTIADNHPTFIMTFNEAVELSNAGGNIYVYKVGDTSPTLVIPLTADMFDNNQVTITYDASVVGGLEMNSDYYVLVDAGAIQDINGNDYAGITDPAEWTFTTGNDFALGIGDDVANTDEFTVYPNPFSDMIYISNYDEISRMFITNVVGQRVKEVTNPTSSVSTSDLDNGIYFITLLKDDDTIIDTQRIIKR